MRSLRFRRSRRGSEEQHRPAPGARLYPLSTGTRSTRDLAAGEASAHHGSMPDQDLLIRPAPSAFNSAAPASATATRALPANLEAEAAFLGAVLIDNSLLEELPVPLRAEHFFEPLHARIFERICVQIDKQMLVNPVTLKPYFDADPAMAELGGSSYLARLTADPQGLLAPRELARQIYDLALLRQLVRVGRELVEGALDTSEDVEPMAQISAAEAALFEVASGALEGSEAESFRGATNRALELIETAINSGGHVSGKTTGFTSINEKCGGLHNSDLIIVAGRPGMGKSSLATNIAFNCADRWLRDKRDGIEKSVGAGVALFSLEMSSDQLATRILAEQAGIPSEALRMGKISRDDFQQLSYASQRLSDLPLFIDDTPALTIGALRSRARRLKRRHDIGLIVIDYLQLLQGSGRASDNRVNEISEISRGLKTLAKELQVPVIALSQLSRAVEQREDKRPMLSDLRESGSIEQDADMVWFIYREDYYVAAREPKVPRGDDDMKTVEAHAAWQAEMERVYGLAELIVAKQRHGSTGKVRLRFEPKITRFSDLAEGEYQSNDYD
jgi:replicative DNA helicase